MVSPRKPLTDITSQVKKNAYFQTAIADPTSKPPSPFPVVVSETSISITVAPPTYPNSPPLLIKLIVGPDPSTQRPFYLPRALLIQHSTLLASILDGKSDKIITLTQHSSQAFQNYADYLHSSIYSVNKHVSSYHFLRTHVQSCLLGSFLGSQDYSVAALHHLHALFLPGANDTKSCADKSCIRASDVAFICTRTAGFPLPPFAEEHQGQQQQLRPQDVDCLAALRHLFFDAVASHWSQRDVVQMGAGDQNADTEKWQDVYHQYADFRARIKATGMGWDGVARSGLLGDVGVYIRLGVGGRGGRLEDGGLGNRIADSGDVGLGVGLGFERARPLPPLPSRRRDSSERNQRGRGRSSADTSDADLSDVRRQSESVQSEEQGVQDSGIAVWEDDEMEL
ncbi:hypothetical protein NX059_006458 [Plenodomus lindquistii]|nr:hypothetical protein NX059_006458 [Plenodomus lindquistii]